MKLPIVVGACLVVGLAGGTFLGKTPPPAATAAAAAKPEAAKPVPASATEVAVDTPKLAPAPDTTTAAASAAPPAARPPLDTARLATTLSKLAPEDAVPLVERLTDDELEAVLRRMSVNRASALIAALPKDRGQSLSKRLLSPVTR